MTMIKSIKPFLIAARAIGLAPYTINSSSISPFKLPTVFIYAFIVLPIHSFVFYRNVTIALGKDASIDKSSPFLVRVISLHSCLLIDIAVSIIMRKRFVSLVDKLHRFDQRLSEFGRPHVDAVLKYWISFFASVGFASTVLYIQSSSKTGDNLTSLITVNFMDIAFLCGMSRYLVVMHLILERFRHLNRSMLEEFPSGFAMGHRWHLQLNIGIVWQLHRQLEDITEKLNSLFSIQLVMWLCNIFLCMMARLYDLFISKLEVYLYLTIRITEEFLKLIALTGICHMLTKEANALGFYLQSPKAKFLRKSSRPEEIIEILLHLLQRPMNISAADFMDLNLSFVLKMMAAITTYLVMVVQVGNEFKRELGILQDVAKLNSNDYSN